MPELAEVEYFRKKWNVARGDRITSVSLHPRARCCRELSLASLRRALVGRRLVRSEAAAKQMAFVFSGGAWLGVHLGMTGATSARPASRTAARADASASCIPDVISSIDVKPDAFARTSASPNRGWSIGSFPPMNNRVTPSGRARRRAAMSSQRVKRSGGTAVVPAFAQKKHRFSHALVRINSTAGATPHAAICRACDATSATRKARTSASSLPTSRPLTHPPVATSRPPAHGTSRSSRRPRA